MKTVGKTSLLFIMQITLKTRLEVAFRDGVWMSIDGTDFHILEPRPFSPLWYSHKFNGPGRRYKIGFSTGTAGIVWAHGPFACGKSDLHIFNSKLKYLLRADEKVIGDGRYIGPFFVDSGSLSCGENSLFSRIRARHEVLNGRLKRFGVLRNASRHRLQLHSKVFFAEANITQISIENEDPLFHV